MSYSKRHKKSNKWLWILGWIFIFPLPLTIIIYKNHEMNQKAKVGILSVVWLVYILIIVFSGSSGSEEKDKAGLVASDVSEKGELSVNRAVPGVDSEAATDVSAEDFSGENTFVAETETVETSTPEEIIMVSEATDTVTETFVPETMAAVETPVPETAVVVQTPAPVSAAETPAPQIPSEVQQTVPPVTDAPIGVAENIPAETTVIPQETVPTETVAPSVPVEETQPQPVSQVPADPTIENYGFSGVVYVTPTGTHYHYAPQCGNGNYSPISLEEAQQLGLAPCEKCVLN